MSHLRSLERRGVGCTAPWRDLTAAVAAPSTSDREIIVRIHHLPRAASTAVLMLSLVACSGGGSASGTASPAPAGDRLDGTRWALMSIADQPIPDGTSASLAFGSGQVSGSSGCNTFNGPYTVSGPDSIDIGPLISTRMACPEPAMAFEATYLAALEGATTWAVPADAPMGTQLTIGGTGPKLVFGKPAGS
jgi:heat shock protein HslJ